MTWQQYVEFTATTALPVASDPEYLRLGVLEEAYEALEVYSALQAAIHGKQKRVLRGDAHNVLQAKDEAIAIAKRRLVEELGDLAWYVARLYKTTITEVSLRQISPAAEICTVSRVRELVYDMESKHATIEPGWSVLCVSLYLAGVSLETVLDANVAKLTARKLSGTIQGEGER